MRTRIVIQLLLLLAVSGVQAWAEQRFPPPDFESGYKQPVLTFQEVDLNSRQIVETVILVLALPVAAWLLLKRRSRPQVFLLGLLSLFYFGFYKKGCICPVGSFQNVALALGFGDYAVPLTVVAIFLLPLIFAAFVGRVFCGAVCPIGALQDVFLVRPVRVPQWLERGLGLLRYYALGLGVYLVVESKFFLICKYDPFVGFFRMSDNAWKFALGGVFVLGGMFIGRPYCRFLCPYGAMLGMFARFSGAGVKITPDECIKCTLCDDACPFGAIRRPVDEARLPARLRAALGIVAVVLVVALAAAGYFASGGRTAGGVLGLWFGLVTGAALIAAGRTPQRDSYEVDHSRCLSCGRCYEYCPREHARLKKEHEQVGWQETL